jgi:hypothetical protein
MGNIETLSGDKALSGFIKIWKFDPENGNSELLVDKENLILKGGAKIIARALGGDPTANIWGMYIGYNNSATFNYKAIDVDYSIPFSGYAAPFGYLREPLTFPAVYLSSNGYYDNTVLFSTMITSATSVQGAPFTTDSYIYEVALVSAADPNSAAGDTVFSRTNFNKIKYDSSFNFTITWGIRILLP